MLCGAFCGVEVGFGEPFRVGLGGVLVCWVLAGVELELGLGVGLRCACADLGAGGFRKFPYVARSCA